MKQGVEALRGIRYKLRMMGVPTIGPTYIYGDNLSIISNTSKPESVLKKKSNNICCHFVSEALAMKECVTTHMPTLRNFSDLLTKCLSGKKWHDLVHGVFRTCRKMTDDLTSPISWQVQTSRCGTWGDSRNMTNMARRTTPCCYLCWTEEVYNFPTMARASMSRIKVRWRR